MLAMLVAGSEASPGNPGPLFVLFQSLGVVHALVLSGAQMHALGNAVRTLLGAGGLGSGKWSAGVTIVVLWMFAANCGFDAPLVRAALVLSLSCLGLVAPRSWVVGFLLHLSLFPDHFGSLSFWMSWICSALLSLSGARMWHWLGMSVVTQLLFQALGWIDLVRPLWTLVLANGAVLLGLNVWVQSAMGWVILVWLLVWPWGAQIGDGLAWICAPIDGACRVILVALRLLV
jgi:predicted membrane metal-binding protein